MARRTINPAGHELDWTETTVLYLQARGWRVVHFPDSRRLVGDRGWPDVFAVREGKVLAIELKMGRRKPQLQQEDWHRVIEEIPGATVLTAAMPHEWRRIEEAAKWKAA